MLILADGSIWISPNGLEALAGTCIAVVAVMGFIRTLRNQEKDPEITPAAGPRSKEYEALSKEEYAYRKIKAAVQERLRPLYPVSVSIKPTKLNTIKFMSFSSGMLTAQSCLLFLHAVSHHGDEKEYSGIIVALSLLSLVAATTMIWVNHSVSKSYFRNASEFAKGLVDVCREILYEDPTALPVRRSQ